jgi:hypothetical protein
VRLSYKINKMKSQAVRSVECHAPAAHASVDADSENLNDETFFLPLVLIDDPILVLQSGKHPGAHSSGMPVIQGSALQGRQLMTFCDDADSRELSVRRCCR